MELKDMILSTLAEMEEINDVKMESGEKKQEENIVTHEVRKVVEEVIIEPEQCSNSLEDERHFCESMRERILVLFEGFQSPNNKNIEAKIDLTLNFLEYLLAVIDERLESLDKK